MFREVSEWSLRFAWSGMFARPSQARVLCYHSVHPKLALSHRPDGFREQVRYLINEGYRIVPLRDLRVLSDGGASGLDKFVVITFDDGYSDNLEYASHILAEFGVAATFFVVAGMVHTQRRNSDAGHRLYSSRPMLSTDDVKALSELGMEVGSHTWDHCLAAEKCRLDPLGFRQSLVDAKEFLESLTNQPCESFAYPNGQRGAFDDLTTAVVREVGHSCAVTTIWGAVQQSPDFWRLPRCEIKHTDSLDVFAEKLSGKYDYLTYCHRLLSYRRTWRVKHRTDVS